MIIRAIKMNHDITAEGIKEVVDIPYVSKKTSRSRIAELLNVKSYWKKKKPFILETNRRLRVKWARERVNWPVERWRKYYFTDESPYVLRFNSRTRVNRTFNDRYEPWVTKATVKHDKKINI